MTEEVNFDISVLELGNDCSSNSFKYLIIGGLIVLGCYLIYRKYYSTENFEMGKSSDLVSDNSSKKTVSTPVPHNDSSYDDQNRSLMGGAISKLDQVFLTDYDGNISKKAVHNMKCSKSCCGSMWPTPFDVPKDSSVCNANQEYMPTNLTCSNEYSTGCACISKKEWEYLASHGGNSHGGSKYVQQAM